MATSKNRTTRRKILVALDPSEESNVRTAELAEDVKRFVKVKPKDGVDGLDGTKGDKGERGDAGEAGRDGTDGEDGRPGEDADAKEEIKKVRRELLGKMATKGGQANRQINVNSSVMSARYADQNLLAGTNAELSVSDDNTFKRADVTIAGSTTPSILSFIDANHDHGSAPEGGFVDHTSILSVGDYTHAEIDEFAEHFNGSFQESFDAITTSDGSDVAMSLEKEGTGDLTMRFSDGFTTFDTTPKASIILTAGSDTSPTTNYIYIPQSTKVLTKSTSTFPTDAEHIKVGFFHVPSAGFSSVNGVYVNQNWIT